MNIATLLILSSLAQTAPVESKPLATPPSASIQGRVTFKGDASKFKPLTIDTGGHEFCSKLTDLKTEAVLLHKSGDLTVVKNVVVFLADAPDYKPSDSIRSVLMDMKDCRFVPHVLAMHAKQQLTVRNSDEMVHSVHLLPKLGKDHNVLMPKQNMQMAFRLKPESEPFPVQSDKNVWMSAWIAVFAHPWFSVTGDDGAFRIDGIPPGRYTLRAWHETFGTVDNVIELNAGGAKTMDVEFEPKMPDTRK